MNKFYATRGFKITTAFCGAIVVFFLGWNAMYPAESDPKGVRYILWKEDILPMNLDKAADTMMGDADRDSLVIGKTKQQLQDRFGFILPIRKSTIGLYFIRYCEPIDGWKANDDIFTIRDTWWVVHFAAGKAVDMRVAKGC
jgi:hypothetical protein